MRRYPKWVADRGLWSDWVKVPFVRCTWRCEECGSEIVREGDQDGYLAVIEHDCSTGDWALIEPVA